MTILHLSIMEKLHPQHIAIFLTKKTESLLKEENMEYMLNEGSESHKISSKEC